jgi:hypothetical protein
LAKITSKEKLLSLQALSSGLLFQASGRSSGYPGIRKTSMVPGRKIK